MKIKNFFLTMAIMLVAVLAVNATETAMPSGLHEHGKNSSDAAVATEAIDSVTISATMPYWVAPDLDPSITPNGLFAWSVSSTIGSIPTTSTTNSVNVLFSAIGSGYVTVFESTAAGCSDPVGTSIPVEIIDKPTASFTSTSLSECLATATSKVLTITPSLATSVKSSAVSITYTLKNPLGTVVKTVSKSIYTGSAANSVAFSAGDINAYGTWTVTITGVSDRISEKSGVAGVVTSGVFTYTVSKVPTTGKIYHKPNN